MKFSGNPAEYAEFYANFQTNIVLYVHNDAERLTRLISQCTGKAAEAIRSCASLSQHLRYPTAWKILRENFGQPNLVFEAKATPLSEDWMQKVCSTFLDD